MVYWHASGDGQSETTCSADSNIHLQMGNKDHRTWCCKNVTPVSHLAPVLLDLETVQLQAHKLVSIQIQQDHSNLCSYICMAMLCRIWLQCLIPRWFKECGLYLFERFWRSISQFQNSGYPFRSHSLHRRKSRKVIKNMPAKQHDESGSRYTMNQGQCMPLEEMKFHMFIGISLPIHARKLLLCMHSVSPLIFTIFICSSKSEVTTCLFCETNNICNLVTLTLQDN